MKKYKISKVSKYAKDVYNEIYYTPIEIAEWVGIEFQSLKELCEKINFDFNIYEWSNTNSYEGKFSPSIEVDYYELLNGNKAEQSDLDFLATNSDSIIIFDILMTFFLTNEDGTELSKKEAYEIENNLQMLHESQKDETTWEEVYGKNENN